MRCRTGPAGLEGSGGRVGNVGGMVRRIKGLAIPAGGETNIGHDSLGAWPRRHAGGFGRTGGESGKTDEGHLSEPRCFGKSAIHGVPHDHTESGGKSLDFPTLVGGRVVDRHTTTAGTVETNVGTLRNADEGSVASAEVQDSGPVVGEVIGKGTSCAAHPR